MKDTYFRPRCLLIGLLIALLLVGCRQTRAFTYTHPKDPSRSLHVSLSLDSSDKFKLTIDGTLVAEKKLDLNPKGTNGLDMTGGFFETEHVSLTCIRDYVSIKNTVCDFNIGAGPSVKVNFD